MLKAVATVTSLTIVILYILLLTITYPFVCWTKHRPSEELQDFVPSIDAEINRQSSHVCLKKHQLDLMPMPSKIYISKRFDLVEIPSKVRIKLNFRQFPSFDESKFTLSIDRSSKSTDDRYPYLGIDESYQLNITSNHSATLVAQNDVGILRGLATFEQLQNQKKKIPIPLLIKDRARFPWRGVMLDVARHFIAVPVIEQLMINMQRVKLNVLHIHFSDDQGFRFESKVHPRLHDKDQFYSQSQVKHLIEFGRERGIRIVPEFDMPAHTSAWFVGYPLLASGEKISYEKEKIWGVLNGTMDVTRQSTYDFLDQFFEEIARIFPDPFVHIGGDECVHHQWAQSKHVQEFMRKERINDYLELQAYFTRRVQKLLRKYNRTLMGWDEIGGSHLPSHVLIQSWRSKNSLIDAARNGYRAILSHGFYLDHMSSAIDHYQIDLNFDSALPVDQKSNILGGEACLWTEYIDSHMVHSRVWPRTAAIAERLWSSKEDSIDCMYKRLWSINRRFFHPDDDQYLKDLSTLATNVTALRLLADVCEPLGLSARDRSRNYTSGTPLNRLVDFLRPESELTDRLIRTRNLSILYSTFVSWTRIELYLNSNHTEIFHLANNLARLGELGLRLLSIFVHDHHHRIVSSRWFYYHRQIIDRLENDVPEIRLAGACVVRHLLEEFHPCSFDLINLSLILIFPLIVIIVQRVVCIRRRLLLPCLNVCYRSCARC